MGFWKLMDGPPKGQPQGDSQDDAPSKPPRKDGKAKFMPYYADAWGIRKLISHCLRNLRLDRVPKVT